MRANWWFLIAFSWLPPAAASACLPAPHPLSSLHETSNQLIYMQINNTKFAIPEHYTMGDTIGKSTGFGLAIHSQGAKSPPQQSKIIYTSLGPSTSVSPTLQTTGTEFRDGIYFYVIDISVADARALLERFVVTKTPADWDETIALFSALLPKSLEYWDPNGCTTWGLMTMHKSIEEVRQTYPTPSMAIIDQALKNKNYNLRYDALRWLRADPWHTPTEADKRLAVIGQNDPIPLLRQLAKESRSQIKP